MMRLYVCCSEGMGHRKRQTKTLFFHEFGYDVRRCEKYINSVPSDSDK